MNPIVVADNLSKQYTNSDIFAVKDISFTLKRGEVLALLGSNGAGKTTTIKMLLGLIAPSKGRGVISGFDMNNRRQMLQGVQQVGAVLEGSRNAYWRLSARQNLHYFGRLRGLSRQQLKQRSDELLTLFGLQDSAEKEVRLFSRGMQQKLALAIALLTNPPVLILDEPTLGLDVAAAKLLEEQIRALNANGTAILLTTHTMPLAERLATHVFVIHKGQQLAYETQASLRQQYQTHTIVEFDLASSVNTENIATLIASFSSVALVERDNRNFLAWNNPTQPQVLELFQHLTHNSVAVEQVRRRKATLEEIFLTLTS